MKKLTSILAIVLAVSLCAGNSYGQWSHRKKDAVIGGAGGAVLGGLISHNHVTGALVGGAAGAGAGYLIGKHKDRRYATTTYAYAAPHTYYRTSYAHRHYAHKYKHKRVYHH